MQSKDENNVNVVRIFWKKNQQVCFDIFVSVFCKKHYFSSGMSTLCFTKVPINSKAEVYK